MESATGSSDTQLDTEDSGNVETNNETKEKKSSNKNCLKTLFTSITVEPYILIYYFSIVISAVEYRTLFLEKACRADLKYSDDVCLKVISGQSDDNITAEAVQRSSSLVAEFNAWKTLLELAIPAIFILFIGPWSDRTGNRKTLFILPLVGEICALIGAILSVYFFLEWSIWMLGLIEIICIIFSGGFAVGFTGCYIYLADVTTEKSRTFRLGVFIIVMKLASFITLPLATRISNDMGYYGTFGTVIAIHVGNLIYTFLRIRDVAITQTEGGFLFKVSQFFHPKNIFETVATLFTRRKGETYLILLVVLAHLIVAGPISGQSNFTHLYLSKKFDMDILAFGLYNTGTSILSVVGILIGVTIFSRWLRFHDSITCIIGTTSFVLASITYGLAPDKYYFYAGSFVAMFGYCGTAALRSLATKVVDKNELGKICSLFSLVDLLEPLIYVPIFKKMYLYSIHTGFLGGIFLLGAGLLSISYILFAILYRAHKRQQRDAVQQPEIKEMHVYENDVTCL